VVRSNTRSDRELELLRLGQPLGRQVAWMEGRGYDDFRVDEVLVELGGGAFLVGRCDELVALGGYPVAEAEFVFGGS